MSNIKQIVWAFLMLAVGVLLCRGAEFANMKADQAKLYAWTSTLAPADIELQGANEWVTGEQNKVYLDEAGLAAFTAVLNAVPQEAIIDQHSFIGTGDISFSFRCDRDADLQREEYVLKYGNGIISLMFDSETTFRYGDRTWTIDDDGLEAYLRGLFPEVEIP